MVILKNDELFDETLCSVNCRFFCCFCRNFLKSITTKCRLLPTFWVFAKIALRCYACAGARSQYKFFFSIIVLKSRFKQFKQIFLLSIHIFWHQLCYIFFLSQLKLNFQIRALACRSFVVLKWHKCTFAVNDVQKQVIGLMAVHREAFWRFTYFGIHFGKTVFWKLSRGYIQFIKCIIPQVWI